MRSSTKTAIGLAVGALLLAAAVAPFSLMLLPNPLPVKVADLGTQLPGTYIQTSSGIFHVFPRAEQADRFPGDALVADPGAVVWVKYKELDALSAYAIYSFEGGKAVPSVKSTSHARLVEIRPTAPLAVGRYYVAVAREGLFGGTDYVYFSVAR